jgi:acyl carrier protein
MESSDASPLERDVAKIIVQTLQLEMDPSSLEPTQPLFGDGLGLDSIDALELSLAISKMYGYQMRSDDPEIKSAFSSLRALARAIERNRTKQTL